MGFWKHIGIMGFAALMWTLLCVSAGAQVNLGKTICDGVSGTVCTPLSSPPQIGQPVNYLITLNNSGQGATTFAIQEDLPADFVPADPAGFISCVDGSGNPVTSAVTSTNPLQINVDLPAFDNALCSLDGYFNTPGAVAINTVSSVSNPAIDASETTVVAAAQNLPVDLSLTKTASTQGLLDLSAGPQTVTYTVTMTTNGDVYLDDYFSIYDQLGIFGSSIPIDAQLDLGSVSCVTTASGGAGLSCPVTNNFSGTVAVSPWQSFVSFGYGAFGPILMQAGDSLTLTYSVTYSVPTGQACVIAPNSDGINNRAFLGLSDGGVAISDSNPANNDTAANGTNSIPMETGITQVDPNCISVPATGSVAPSPLVATKEYVGWQPGGNAGPVPWNQNYITYWVEVTNTSATDPVLNIELSDVYSNLPHTPNHYVQLYAADIQQCPPGSTCQVTSPPPSNAPQGPAQAINSYFDTATIWTGTVDKINPGETVGVKVALTVVKPTCDFAFDQHPKRVRNHIYAQHEYNDVDPLTGDPVDVPGLASAYADVEVEKTKPCEFKVNKRIRSLPDDEVTFGTPINYELTFQNGPEAINAGTLMDVLRIEDDYYALGLDVSYQWKCTEDPSGSVVNFTTNGSGSGSVNYVQDPHQGLRVMEHPGFVSFAANARLICKIEVIVSPPDPSDPYCFSSGTPTLGNAAIIDGSLFYNGSLDWAPAPQGSTWDSASSELPKCYHLVVNKEVTPLTTTPDFGPDLTYSISITNASGSPSPVGDINFPPGPVPAGAAPWSGPVFTDTFQTGPFPIVPPNNPPILTVDPCLAEGTDPCDWIGPVTTSGSVVGVSKLLAGNNLTYSYALPHLFNPHELCNDIEGELLIDGQTSDRWYAKKPVTLEDGVCALIRTNVAIKKSFDIDPLITVPSTAEFTVDINCIPPAGFNVVPMSVTVSQADPYAVQAGIIVGSTCTVAEQTPDESLLPPHCDWNAPEYPDGQTFIADGSQEPWVVPVHNSTTCRYGDIEVRKTVTGNGMPPAGTLFDMSINCGAPANQIYVLNVAGGTYEEQTDIPDASSCTVTETPPVDFTDSQGRLCIWGTPTYSPSQTVSSDHQFVHTIEVTNPLDCQSSQDILITKQIDLGTSGLSLPAGLTYDLDVTCTDLSGNTIVNQTVSLAAGTSQTIPGVSMPATCTVSEIPPTYQLPSNCTWGDPTYVGGGTQTLTYNPAVTSQDMTVINTPTCGTGSVVVSKSWNSGNAPFSLLQQSPPSGALYTMNISCADGSVHSASMGVNQSQTITGLPANTSCTLTESLPPYPGNTANKVCSYRSPNYSPSNTFTVPVNGTHTVNVVNSSTCEYLIGGGGPVLTANKAVKVEKVVNVPGVTLSGSTFSADVTCGNQTNTVNLTPGAAPVSASFSPLMIGYNSTCTVTETSPQDSLLPANCTWNPPTYSPSQTVTAAAQATAPVVTITNTATCAPAPGTLDIIKDTILPAGLTLSPAPSFQANVYCFDLPFSWQGWTSSSPVITAGLNASVVSGSNQVCWLEEQMPSAALPNGCEWMPPVYPNGQVAYLNSGQTETRKIENRVLCEEGSFTIEKSFHPDSEPVGNNELFQVQVDCGTPINTSTVHTVSAGAPVTIDGILGTECTVTELTPLDIDYCSWEPVIYQSGGVSSTDPARVETSLSVPVVNMVNQLVCDFPPADLEITKTLIDNEPCYDPATGQFSCDFQITITNTGGTDATGPFTVEDTLSGLLGYTPPTAASGGWDCTLPSPVYPAALPPLSCESPSGLIIPASGSTSFVIDTNGFAFFPPGDNCAGMLDQDGQYIESCVNLTSPELEIEKVLSTPDCAQNPITECLFQVTVSNIGSGDYTGVLLVHDVAGAIGSATQLTTTMTSGPTNGWVCYPQSAASINHSCLLPSTTLPAGGSTSFQFGMDGSDFRMTDMPENCASLLTYEPLQESCVPVPWTPNPWMNISKSVVSCPTPSVCTFEITVSNASSTIAFNGPISVDDAVSPAAGTYVSNTGNYTCSTSGTLTCDSNGNVAIPPLGSDSFQLTLDLSGGPLPEENCATLTSTYQNSDPVSCVPIVFPPASDFDIVKTQITPGYCHGANIAGAANPNLCTFEITITNNSGVPYTGDVVFSDQALMGTYAVPAPPVNWGPQPDWSCAQSGTAVTCTQTNITLNPGNSTTILLTLDLSAIPAPYSENCATLITPGSGESCISKTAQIPDAQIQILKTYAPGSDLPPGNVNFAINVECAWPTNLPAWSNVYTTYGAPGAPTGNTQSVAAGATCTVTEQPITADPGAGCSWLPPVYLPAQSVTAVSGQLSTVTVQNAISCGTPNLTIVKTLNGPCINAMCSYDITITNTGPGTFIGPMVVDDAFTNTGGGSTPWLVSTVSNDNWVCSPQGQAQTFTCTEPNLILAPSSSTTFTTTFDLEPGTAYDNCASVTNPYTGAPITDCASIPPASNSQFDITKAQLTPGVCHGGTTPGAPNPNLCEFEITVTNLGPDPYQGDVTFSDQVGWGVPNLYGPTPPTAFNPPPWTCVANGTQTDCTYPGANLAVGQSLTMTVTLDMISVTGGGPTENCATLTTPAASPAPEACIPIGLEPELTIQKSLLTPPDCINPPANGNCEFQITVTNTGAVNFTGQLSVDDNVMLGGSNFPGTLAVTTQPAAPWYCATQSSGQFRCETTQPVTVPAGGSVSFTVTLNLSHPVRPDENCATLMLPQMNPAPVSCVPLTPEQTANLTITKTPTGTCQNGFCTYDITVTNQGPGTFTGPMVIDDAFTLTGGGTTPWLISTTSADSWTCTPQGQAVSFTCTGSGLNLPPGGSTIFTTAFDLEPGKAYDNCASTTNPFDGATITDCASIQGSSVTNGYIYVVKLISPDSDFVPDSAAVYGMEMSCQGATIPDFTVSAGTSNANWVYVDTPGACTVTETTMPAPPPGCVWDTPTYSPAQTVMAQFGVSKPVRVTNSLTCTPPTSGNLDISKALSPTTPCDDDGVCTFDITITNPGSTVFTDPISFTDMVSFGGTPAAVPVVSQSSGWNCNASSGSASITCASNGSVTIAPGGWVTVTLTVNLEPTHPMHLNNCVQLTDPAQTPPAMDCIPVTWGAMTYMQVTKVMAPDSDFMPPAGTVFTVNISCSGLWQDQTALVAPGASDLVNLQTSPGNCTVTEAPQAVPNNAPAGCSWDAPVYSPAQPMSIADGGFEEVTITNRMSCQPQPSNLTFTKELVNCSNGICEFALTVSNTGPGAFSGPLSVTDLVTAPGSSAPYPAFYMNSASTDPWTCAGAGQSSVLCNTPGVSLGAGDTSTVNLTMDIPQGQFENCATLDQAAPLSPLQSCVTVPAAQQLIAGGGGTSPLVWDIGTAVAIPIAGDVITGGMINDVPLTDSADVAFDDVYDAGLGISAGIDYPLSDSLSVVGGLSYQSFSGNAASLGTIDGEQLRGTMDDMKRLNADAGMKYKLPEQTVGERLPVRPYVEGRAGVAHTSAIGLRNAQLGQNPENSGNIGLYKDSISPTVTGKIGVEIPVNDNFDMAVEAGISRTGALKSDDSYFGPGVPLAGTNNAKSTTDAAVGVKVRSKF